MFCFKQTIVFLCKYYCVRLQAACSARTLIYISIQCVRNVNERRRRRVAAIVIAFIKSWLWLPQRLEACTQRSPGRALVHADTHESKYEIVHLMYARKK